MNTAQKVHVYHSVHVPLGIAFLLTVLSACQLSAAPPNVIQDNNLDGTISTWAQGYGAMNHVQYHPQVTAYFCGAAAMEMELDCTAVRTGNAAIDKSLGAGVAGANPGPGMVDGAPRLCFPMQFNWPPITYQNVGGNFIVVSGFQTFVYGLVHGLNTYNGLTYRNPFYPPGTGTTLDDVQVGLNLMDSPVYTAAGPHNYISYNILTRDWANRTISDGLAQLGIPAAAIVSHGAHWVCVVGVKSDVVPVANGPYIIYGFYVQDPWTGYQQANPFGPNGALLPPGLGEEEFLSTRINPNRVAGDELWEDLFNLSPGPPLPLYGSGLGYKFEVEPIGPVPLDTGNSGEYSSIPAPSPILTNAPITAAQALVFATNAIAADAFMSIQPGFSNGTWNVADATLVKYPLDGANEGDWLIPYEGSGGSSDVTGFVLVDEETGNLDQAEWMNPGDTVSSMTLSSVETMETDEFDDILPDDNVDIGQMSIQPPDATNNVVISWPALDLFTNTLALQKSTSLPGSWTTLTNVPVLVSGQNQVAVPASGPQAFFRLFFTTTNTPPPPQTNSGSS